MDDIDRLPSPTQNARFTEAVSQRMNVPYHIRPAGESAGLHDLAGSSRPADTSHAMRVPERIVVAGGGTHAAVPNDPSAELTYDKRGNLVGDYVCLETPPRQITLHQHDDMRPVGPGPSCTDGHNCTNTVNDAEPLLSTSQLPLDAASQASMELSQPEKIRVLKRHVMRLATRLYAIEQEMETRRSRELVFGFSLVGYIAFNVLRWVLGRR